MSQEGDTKDTLTIIRFGMSAFIDLETISRLAKTKKHHGTKIGVEFGALSVKLPCRSVKNADLRLGRLTDEQKIPSSLFTA